MAVQIPVIVDIQGAFNDAASRVRTAMQPLQRALSNNALKIQIGDTNLAGIKQSFEQGAVSANELKTYINELNAALSVTSQTNNRVRFTALLEAKSYLQDMSLYLDNSRLHIDGLANTLNGLNARLTAAKNTLNGSAIGSTAWVDATSEIDKVSAKIKEVRAQIAELGMNTGSIDSLTMRLRQLRETWSGMGKSQMFDSNGQLAAEAQKLQTEYTSVTAQLEKQQQLLTAQIEAQRQQAAEAQKQAAEQKRIADEQARRAQLLSTTATTLGTLNAQIAAAQTELQNADFGSAKFNQMAQQLGELSRRLADVQSWVKLMGTESTSIDGLNAKLQRLNMQYNQLSKADRMGAAGQSMLSVYRQLSTELARDGQSLAQIVQEEERVAAATAAANQKLAEENAILAQTAPNLATLQKQATILQERLSKAALGSAEFNNLKNQLEAVRAKIAEVNGGMASFGTQTRKANTLLMQMGTYLKGMGQMAIFGAATRFLKNVREVTAEFEMQRVALAGIIQDTAEANKLFQQIKAAAIQSPFEIKDLVTYTKQLSAYRIETDKLFETTMRLADVSAGLGVDMNRIILAYGQVRAASVLRGQELRQFTEAGIPLVGLLADKFTQLRGEIVSTAEVFQLISKRQVPFEMVAEIFEEMTDKGGTFYKMQEKQSNTLKGQYQKLKDAVSIMYDEIGNTGPVHNAMSTILDDLLSMMRNWREIATIFKTVVALFGTMKVASLFIPRLTKDTQMLAASNAALNRAVELEARGMNMAAANASRYAVYMQRAATATTSFGRGINKFLAGFLSGGWVSLVLTILTVVVGKLISARQEANRLNNEIAEINATANVTATQGERNFNRLAKTIVEAADGSVEQREALKELQRTYGDILPSQKLQVEALREMKGGYEELTNAIKEKIRIQAHEQELNKAEDFYSNKLTKKTKAMTKEFSAYGYSSEEVGRIISGLQDNLDKFTNDAGKIPPSLTKFRNIINEIIEQQTGKPMTIGASAFSSGYLEVIRDYLKVYNDMNTKIDNLNERFEASNNNLAKFDKYYKKIQEEVSKTPMTTAAVGTFEYNEVKTKQHVDAYVKYLKEAFEEAGVKYGDAFQFDGLIDFKTLFEKAQDAALPGLENFVKKVQKAYVELIPDDKMVALVKQAVTDISKTTGVAMDTSQRYFKTADETMQDYVKRLQDALTKVQNSIKEMNLFNKEAEGVLVAKKYTQDEISEATNLSRLLEALIALFGDFKKTKKNGSGSGQDPFILLMKNRIKFAQDFQKSVEDLEKYMGSSAALSSTRGTMEGRGKSVGFDVNTMLGTPEELRDWYDKAIKEVVGKIQKMGGKEFSGLGVTEILAKDLTGRKIQKYQELLQELWKGLTDFDLNQLKTNIDKAISLAQKEMKRSETARGFYDNILGITGDEDLSRTITISVYGDVGGDFSERIKKGLDTIFKKIENPSEDMKKAFENVDFGYILDHINEIPEKWRSMLEQMASDSQKYNADLQKAYAEALTKYGDIERRREVLTEAANKKIADVRSAAVKQLAAQGLTEEDKNGIKKDTEEIVNAIKGELELNLEKLSDDYADFFGAINVMTTEQARIVRQKLREAYLKAFRDGAITADELRRNLKAIDTQYKELIKDCDQFSSIFSEGLEGSSDKLRDIADEIQYLAAKMQKGDELNSNEQGFLNRFFDSKLYEKIEKSLTKAGKLNTQNSAQYGHSAESLKEIGDEIDKAADSTGEWVSVVDQIVTTIDQAVQAFDQLISEYTKMMNEDDASEIEHRWAFVKDFNNYAKSAWDNVKSGNYIGAAADLVSSVMSVFNNIQQLRVDKYDKEIEEQQERIDDLSYSYDRLSSAIEKSFGNEYIYNYQEQVKNLQAQYEAYQKQYEAEKNKGKSQDKDALKQYEESMRDVSDQLKDVQNQVAEFMLGTDLYSAAKDFADSWLEAYKSFSSTADAIKEKMADMVDELISNAMLSGVAQAVLQPLYTAIADASTDGDLTTEEVADIIAMVPALADNLNTALTSTMAQLEAAGVNVRELGSTDYSGISRDISSATEESITGLAAGVNTQNFYMQHIDQNVATIMALLGGGSDVSTGGEGGIISNTEYYNQMLSYVSYIPTIDQNLSALLNAVKSVITPKSANTNTHCVAIK